MHMASAAGMVAPFLLVLVPMAISEPPWLVSEGRTEESAPLGVSSLLQQQEAETFPTSSSESSAGPSTAGTRTNASSRPGDVDPAPLHMGKVGATATSRWKSIVRSTYTLGSPVHRPAKRASIAHERTSWERQQEAFASLQLQQERGTEPETSSLSSLASTSTHTGSSARSKGGLQPGLSSFSLLQPKDATEPQQLVGKDFTLEQKKGNVNVASGQWILKTGNAKWGVYYGRLYKPRLQVGAVYNEETGVSESVVPPKKEGLLWKGGSTSDSLWKVMPELDSESSSKFFSLTPPGGEHTFVMQVTASSFFRDGKKTFYKIEKTSSSEILECDDDDCKTSGTQVATIKVSATAPIAIALFMENDKWSDDFGPLVLAAAILGKGPNNK